MAVQRIKDRWFVGNLSFTDEGDVLATWRLTRPMPRAFTEQFSAFSVKQHQALMRAIVGNEFLLSGMLAWTDDDTIVDRMLADVDIEASPGWVDEVVAFVSNEVPDLPLGTRVWYLTVKLRRPIKEQLRAAATTTFNRLCDSVGLAALPPGPDEIQRALSRARRIDQQLPRSLQPVAVSAAEQIWMRLHLTHRDASMPDFETVDDDDDDLTGRGALGEPLLDQGAISDLDPKDLARRATAPFQRRFVKVATDRETATYQAGLVLSRTPKMMVWPDYEFLGRIDDYQIPMTIGIRGVSRPRNHALAKNRTAMSQLNDQVDQIDPSNPQVSGHMTRLADAADLLAEYNDHITRDDREVEVEAVVMVSISMPDATMADTLARDFMRETGEDDFVWARPIGADQDIFWAMQPSGDLTPQLKDYKQITHSENWGTAVPITSHEVGSEQGVPVAINRTAGILSPVYMDLFGECRKRDIAPTVVTIGVMGSGKTTSAETLGGAYVDRGARLLATDNSHIREWLSLADTFGKHTRVGVVDFAEPKASLDPLRMLPLNLAGPVVSQFLGALLNIGTMDKEGILLGKILRASYLAEHQITSMGGLQHHLETSCQLMRAEHTPTGTRDVPAEIAEKMMVFSDLDANSGLAAGVFDPDLPPVSLNDQVLLIGTSNLVLPTEHDLTSETMFRQMPIAKMFGRAAYALITQMAVAMCFRSNKEEALFNLDEFHAVKTSPEATASVTKFIRDGRKHLGAFNAQSHDVVDLGSDTLRDLISWRFVLRSDDQIASRCASFLGADPDKSPELHADLTERIKTETSGGKGAGLMRDPWGRVGSVNMLLPARPERRAAVSSTPPAKDLPKTGRRPSATIRDRLHPALPDDADLPDDLQLPDDHAGQEDPTTDAAEDWFGPDSFAPDRIKTAGFNDDNTVNSQREERV